MTQMVHYSRSKGHSFCLCLQLPPKCKTSFKFNWIEHLYYEIIDMIVCNRDSKECMVHRCKKCPGIGKAWKFIQNILNGDVGNDLYLMLNSCNGSQLTEGI